MVFFTFYLFLVDVHVIDGGLKTFSDNFNKDLLSHVQNDS